MQNQAARRWHIEAHGLEGADVLLLRFASTRAHVLSGRVTFVPLPEKGAGRGARDGAVTAELRLEDGYAVARTPIEVVSGTYAIQIDAVSEDGAALLGAVAFLKGAEIDRRPTVRRTGAVALPDWIVDREGFRARFGRVGERRFEAFAVPVYELAVSFRIWDEELSSSLLNEVLALLQVDEDAARFQALEVACAAGRYFAEIDMRSSKPFVPGDLPQGVLTNGRDKLDDRINARAAYGVAGKSWTAEALTLPTLIGLEKFANKTSAMFEKAEQQLADPGGGVHPVEWAFELFVSGRLAVAHPFEFTHNVIMVRGAPDGEAFLLFAELASQCLELGVEVDFWRPRFRHLVRMMILFEAHPATDAAIIQDLGHSQANLKDLYSFYDGKQIAMRTVFDLRRSHAEVLDPLGPADQRALLEDAFTWAAGRIRVADGSVPGAVNPPDLVLEPKLFLPGQLAST